MLSWVLRGGEVIDGTGSPPRRADVGLLDGKVVRLGDIEPSEMPHERRVLDVTGLAVTPGFIDVHSHSDLTLPVHNGAESSLVQGITTEVAGSCGWSLAPAKDETVRKVLRHLLQALCGISGSDLKFAWHSFAEYAEFLAKKGTGTNLYPVLGQSLLRAHVVGTEKRPATPEEVAAMRAMLRQAMADGCRGLSTGRSYVPGGHADTDEVAALCAELAPHDGIYTSHIKSESGEMLLAVEEVIEIARRAGIKALVSHHKAIGPANFGRVKESLELMERARAADVDVHCDVYPYAFAQVYRMRDALVPRSWRSQPADRVIAKLRDPEVRTSMRRRLARGTGNIASSADNYLLIEVPGRSELHGLSVQQAADKLGADVLEMCCDLLVETQLDVRIAARMDEADVQTVLGHPMSLVGTDAFTIDGQMPAEVPLHPRHYGTFPRVVGHYARDVGLFTLAEAVRKVTSLPAGKLGLTDRGTIAEGQWGDLVVLDPVTVVDRATATSPALPPAGIRAVFVNGELALGKCRPTGVKAGRVLLGRRG